MEIKYGLISADSHTVLDRDTFTRRMSSTKWGDLIPHIVETTEGGRTVDRWLIHGRISSNERGVANCPAAMPDPTAHQYPERWEEVPARAVDPLERLEALDSDGVDAEVLFPTGGRLVYMEFGDEFELDCVRAYNDAMAEWRELSDRYAPLAMIPYLCDIKTTVAEVERAARMGHRGIEILSEPSLVSEGAKHFNDAHWEPLWAFCEEAEVPIHIHESGGISQQVGLPRWSGYTRFEYHVEHTVPTGTFPAQVFANIFLSGLAERHPRLKWVSAEAGLGWVMYVLEGCDHEWERRHLWTEGIRTRPSEMFRRQVYVDTFCEVATLQLRHEIGIDNIMWQTDYPHTASTFPRTWELINQSLKGVPEDERKKMLYQNALRLYKLG